MVASSEKPSADEPNVSQSDPKASPTDIQKKRSQISQASDSRDITALVKLAGSHGGLLDDDLRKDAWPLLLGCDTTSVETPNDSSWTTLPAHRDEEQVELDVNRAFVYYPNGQSDKDLDVQRKALSGLIRRILRSHPMLCYFQGYHDIVQVMLLVLGESKAIGPIGRLSLLRIRDYMLPSLTPAVKHLQLLPALLNVADPELCEHLAQTKPYFALASTLTLYAHDIQRYEDIVRLYDFLLAHEPVIAIYMFAALIISRKEELLEIPEEEPEMLHFTLTKLPPSLDLEMLIQESLVLFESFPPNTLPYGAWRRISSYSVMKTSRDLGNEQSLGKGESYFLKQAQQLRIEELQQRVAAQIWKHRRPAKRIFLAVLVGAVSLWLRKSGHDKTLLWSLWNLKEWIVSRV